MDGHPQEISAQEIFAHRFDAQLDAAATAIVICCRDAANFHSRLALGTSIAKGGF
jgi:hypothetical protein